MCLRKNSFIHVVVNLVLHVYSDVVIAVLGIIIEVWV